jgi:hypothetical protein
LEKCDRYSPIQKTVKARKAIGNQSKAILTHLIQTNPDAIIKLLQQIQQEFAIAALAELDKLVES